MTTEKRPIVYLSRRESFSAAHRLWAPGLTEARNVELFGPCAREYGHGHNYVLEVTLRGGVDPDTGIIVNLTEVRDAVRSLIIDKVDHRHLNCDSPLCAGVNPTTENLAVLFWNTLSARFGTLLFEISSAGDREELGRLSGGVLRHTRGHPCVFNPFKYLGSTPDFLEHIGGLLTETSDEERPQRKLATSWHQSGAHPRPMRHRLTGRRAAHRPHATYTQHRLAKILTLLSRNGFLNRRSHVRVMPGSPVFQSSKVQLVAALTGLRIDLQERHRCVPRPSRDLGGARTIGHLKQQAGHQVAPEQAQKFFGHRVGIANDKPG